MDNRIEKENQDSPTQITLTSDNGKKSRKAKRRRNKRKRRCKQFGRKVYAG